MLVMVGARNPVFCKKRVSQQANSSNKPGGSKNMVCHNLGARNPVFCKNRVSKEANRSKKPGFPKNWVSENSEEVTIMSVQLLKRKFTVEQYRQMARAGILAPGDRVELIRGEIVEMSPIGPRHAACVRRLNAIFSQRLSDRAIVDIQNPVELDDSSEPQPDVILLEPRADFYETRHPQPKDILLIVEVANTTTKSDRQVKITLYAEDGIAEVWLVDINEQAVEVYRNPTPQGYRQFNKFQRGENLSIQAFPDVAIAVSEILG